MARHSKHEEHEEHASEAWLVAFADMMTLLMVTFLMMFAISALDLQKFKVFQEAFEAGLGKQLPAAADPSEKPVPEPPAAPAAAAAPTTTPAAATRVLDRAALTDLKAQLDAAVAAAGLSGLVQTDLQARGLVLYITNGVLFDPSKAQLTLQGQALLTRLGPVLGPFSNELVIEGHTDSRPISTPQFPSNWELSTARATAVLRHLLETDHLAAGRLSAAGYADTRPRDTGASAAALAANRRVDIVVLAPQLPAQAAAAPTVAPTPAATTRVGTSSPAPSKAPLKASTKAASSGH